MPSVAPTGAMALRRKSVSRAVTSSMEERNSTSTFTAHTSGSEAIVLTVPLINMVPMSASSSHASLHHSTIATVFAGIRTGAASVAVVSSRRPPPMRKCLPTLYAALNTTRCTLLQVSGLTAGNRRPQASTNTLPHAKIPIQEHPDRQIRFFGS